MRNPYFRQWSYAAQPAGYPSVIRYEQVKSQSAQESAVIAGQADLASLEEGDLQSLAIQYPARVFFGPKMGTAYASLNTRLPPFTNLKARQAVNYAIDRARILQFFHFASGQATVTCQMLPPGFPGYQRLLPLHGRRRGRGLARPGHGEGATAGQGIRHEEHAGDRLEPR